MRLGDLVEEFIETRRPGWLVLDDEQVLAQAIAATRYYIGFASLSTAASALDQVDDGTEVTPGEWATICPLFSLYVEKENALRLEASRGLGLDVFGRQSSEVQAEIRIMEDETLPQRAFAAAPFEVS